MNKPPIGVKPRFILEEERIYELSEAIKRFLAAECEIPFEWIEEYNELIQKKKAREIQ